MAHSIKHYPSIDTTGFDLDPQETKRFLDNHVTVPEFAKLRGKSAQSINKLIGKPDGIKEEDLFWYRTRRYIPLHKYHHLLPSSVEIDTRDYDLNENELMRFLLSHLTIPDFAKKRGSTAQAVHWLISDNTINKDDILHFGAVQYIPLHKYKHLLRSKNSKASRKKQ
ncbi:hypothetical protein PV783_34055 [Chitinophaga sp. CC14]|uniref:hypothetical protein n=1 Tax=Chitinophaga sp. CC14 TaxID=3029199 RepID=UPI003B78162D